MATERKDAGCPIHRVLCDVWDSDPILLNDGAHSYSYDQEGNLIYVDGGQTTWDNYDALNRRVLHVTGGYTDYKRYEYDIDGRLAGVWQDEDTYQRLQRYYGPKGDSFAYWTGGVNLSNEQVHYQHTDYLGTVKARTDPNHNTEAYYVDLPFGERAPDLIASTDANTEHYATLDRDTESDTHHAQFRTYEPRIGRWLQPDPYDGSYRRRNPQSFNRYSYALNNPLSLIDPSGLTVNDKDYGGDTTVYAEDPGVLDYWYSGLGGGAGGVGGGGDAGLGSPDEGQQDTPAPSNKPQGTPNGKPQGRDCAKAADTAFDRAPSPAPDPRNVIGGLITATVTTILPPQYGGGTQTAAIIGFLLGTAESSLQNVFEAGLRYQSAYSACAASQGVILQDAD